MELFLTIGKVILVAAILGCFIYIVVAIFPGWGLVDAFSPAFERWGKRMGLNTTMAEVVGRGLSIAVIGLCSLAAWYFLGGWVWVIMIGMVVLRIGIWLLRIGVQILNGIKANGIKFIVELRNEPNEWELLRTALREAHPRAAEWLIDRRLAFGEDTLYLTGIGLDRGEVMVDAVERGNFQQAIDGFPQHVVPLFTELYIIHAQSIWANPDLSAKIGRALNALAVWMQDKAEKDD